MNARQSLTGNQLWCIRTALAESQASFGKRLGVNQVRVLRLEARKSEDLSQPDPDDILRAAVRVAEEMGIAVPSPEEAEARRRSAEEQATAEAG